jgi:hypothetical protein
MPVTLVRSEWKAWPDPVQVARVFGVSAEAMQWRLYNAGLVPERPT